MKYNKIKKKTKNLNIKFEYSYINLEILKDLGPYCAIILNFINLLSKNDKFNGYIPIEWVKEQTNFSVNTIRKSLEILNSIKDELKAKQDDEMFEIFVESTTN